MTSYQRNAGPGPPPPPRCVAPGRAGLPVEEDGGGAQPQEQAAEQRVLPAGLPQHLSAPGPLPDRPHPAHGGRCPASRAQGRAREAAPLPLPVGRDGGRRASGRHVVGGRKEGRGRPGWWPREVGEEPCARGSLSRGAGRVGSGPG